MAVASVDHRPEDGPRLETRMLVTTGNSLRLSALQAVRGACC
jgi:hypothetical protein